MWRHTFKTLFARRLEVIVSIATVMVILSLLWGKPHIAWNSGARERLSDELRRIASAEKADLGILLRRGRDERGTEELIALANNYRIATKWYCGKVYEDVYFYPVAVNRFDLEREHTQAAPIPWMVMVPADRSDSEFLSHLYGCNRVEPSESVCQSMMRRQFLTYCVNEAATLMSDGSIQFISPDVLLAAR